MALLDGKVAVITGAGSGMAKASTKVFVREGAQVVAADISGAEKDTAVEVGDAVLPVHCDVTQEADVAALFDAAVAEFGRVDAVLNVAGIGASTPLTDITMEDYDRMMDVDLRGVLLGMKYGIRAMLKNAGRRLDRQLVVDRRAERVGDGHLGVLGGQGGCHRGHQGGGASSTAARGSGPTRSAPGSS